ncbi:MAG TPA: response regulator transcription factor [Chloroflexota bacterium]|jgi:two-component system KDP operon response regulator KdpE
MSQGSGARILVVDDEPALVRAVETNLRKHDFWVDRAATGEEALEAYSRIRPDLVLLDLGLPDVDGLQVIRSIRSHASTPIVVLSARGAEGDKVAALEQGADDYLTKPFGARELLARVRVALRHAAGPPHGTEPIVIAGDLSVDLEHRRVTLAGRELHLTPTEYDLLKIFVANPDKVLTDRMLVETVWGVAYRQQAHSLHVYVARLRKKLEADPQVPRYLLTEPGVGYRFVTESTSHIAV